MAHIIQSAPKTQPTQPTFTIDQSIRWYTPINDRGMITGHYEHTGKIIKVCPKNLHVKDELGNMWCVSKKEAK